MMKMLAGILGIAALATGGACASPDPCTAAHQRIVASPSGTRRLSIFSGPCPNAAPQVLVEFEHGAGGTGVFAVAESTAEMSGRWITDDSVEIYYPANARVVKREAVAQHGADRVGISYATLSGVARVRLDHPIERSRSCATIVDSALTARRAHLQSAVSTVGIPGTPKTRPPRDYFFDFEVTTPAQQRDRDSLPAATGRSAGPIVQFVVDSVGVVDTTTVAIVAEHGRPLIKAAVIATLRERRFFPARIGTCPVAQLLQVTLPAL
jgi:hypothetical protein